MGTSLIRPPPSWDPTGALCLGTYGDPRGVAVSYERGTPVHLQSLRIGSGFTAEGLQFRGKGAETRDCLGVDL